MDLPKETAQVIADACNDPANPDRQFEARATLKRWLLEIELRWLIPGPGAAEVLSNIRLH